MYGEFKFFSVNKETDWQKGSSANLDISDEGLLLKNTARYSVCKTIRAEDTSCIESVTDFSVGRHGVMYLLDAEANLLVYNHQNRQCDSFFKSGHGLFTGAAMLAACGDMIFAADWRCEQKIIGFSASNGQALTSVERLNEAGFFPICTASDGTRYLYTVIPLDCTGCDAGKVLIRDGSRLGVLKTDMSGRVEAIFCDTSFCMRGIGGEVHVDRLRNKFFIAASSSGQVCVLDAENGVVFVFSSNGRPEGHFNTKAGMVPSGLCMDKNGFIYIGDGRKLSFDAEDDRFISKFDIKGELLETISSFRGRSDKLVLDAEGRMYVWNGEARSVTVMEPRTKVMEYEKTGHTSGVYLSLSFDSTASENQWHKMLLDAVIPESTQIRVSYFASDRKGFIINGKYIDLDDYITDLSMPMDEKLRHLDAFWSEAVVNPRDALFHGAKGRYLWVRMEFMGTEYKTPVLRKMRLYYPRMSYLSYLPAVYQEDEVSRDFLERFLSLFGTYLTDMEDRISNVSRYFEVDAVPEQFLKWLSTWLAISTDDSWTNDQLRQLIRRAPYIYKKRGTRQAIEEIIEIYTGEKPFIVEYFQYKHMRDDLELKNLISQLYSMDPYCFCVLVKQDQANSPRQLMAIQKILDEEKPAFTEVKLIVLQPWIYMDMHTYTGINTYLSELSLLRLDQKSSIPFNTVLVDVDLDNRMEMHTRLELDAELE